MEFFSPPHKVNHSHMYVETKESKSILHFMELSMNILFNHDLFLNGSYPFFCGSMTIEYLWSI
jgi:hypothetical protein